MTRPFPMSWMIFAARANAQFGYGGNGGGGFNFGGSSGGNGNPSSNGASFGGLFGANGLGFDVNSAIFYRNVHGILAALAFAGLFPLGSILMRVVPGRFAWMIHGITQISAYIIYIAGAALGIYLVRMVHIPPNGTSLLDSSRFNAHPIIGLIVLVVIFIQPALGFIHHVKFKRLGRRTGWSYAHLWIGRAMITLGIINGGLGLQLAGARKPAMVAYSVIAAIMWLLWASTAILAESRRQRASREKYGQGF